MTGNHDDGHERDLRVGPTSEIGDEIVAVIVAKLGLHDDQIELVPPNDALGLSPGQRAMHLSRPDPNSMFP